MSNAFVVWLTGLPASGKSELAAALQHRLLELDHPAELIDSGKLRQTPLGQTLGFSKNDRETNVLRHGITARLLLANGVIAIVSAVSPYRAVREAIRAQVSPFVEVYVSTPAAACQERDQSGNWRKALAGELEHFTGVSDPYEAPTNPDLNIDHSQCNINDAVALLLDKLQGLLSENNTTEELSCVANRLAQLGYTDNQ